MFADKAREILENGGWRKIRSPFDLLVIWERVVSSMEAGYQFGIYEYDNDVSVRAAIEALLTNDELTTYSEYGRFKKTIGDIDTRLRRILSKTQKRNDRTVWWEAGVLRNAGSEYVKDVIARYGPDVGS